MKNTRLTHFMTGLMMIGMLTFAFTGCKKEENKPKTSKKNTDTDSKKDSGDVLQQSSQDKAQQAKLLNVKYWTLKKEYVNGTSQTVPANCGLEFYKESGYDNLYLGKSSGDVSKLPDVNGGNQFVHEPTFIKDKVLYIGGKKTSEVAKDNQFEIINISANGQYSTEYLVLKWEGKDSQGKNKSITFHLEGFHQ